MSSEEKNGNLKEKRCEGKDEFAPITQISTVQRRKTLKERARNMKAKNAWE